MQGGSGLSLEQIVKFDWQVALGEHTLTLRELETLARLKAPLVQVRGQWVQINAEEIQAALDFWKKQGDRPGHACATWCGWPWARRRRRAAWRSRASRPTAGSRSSWTSWKAKRPSPSCRRPAGFQGTLRPYQVRGYSWLAFLRRWGLGACLADDMGLGKTIQTLALIQRDWESDGRRPTLLICPTSVVGNWKKEAERFTPDLPVLVHHGLTADARATPSPRRREQARPGRLQLRACCTATWTCSRKSPWAGVILDEAQNIKNPETKQAQAARSLTADYRIALTGTPVENHVGDLWSIMEFLNPGLLGTPGRVPAHFFVPDPGPARRRGGRPAQAADRAVPPAPAQDRQERSSPTCPTSWR